jgi:hypothetical protein
VRTYTAVWTLLVAALGGLGAFVALLDTDAGVLFGLVSLAALLTAGAAYLHQLTGTRPVDLHWIVVVVLLGSAVALAAVGLVEFLAAAWIPAAVVLTATSPGLVGRFGRRVSGAVRGLSVAVSDPYPAEAGMTVEGSGAALGASPTDRPLPPSRMSGHDLCLAWRTSFAALQRVKRGSDVRQQARLVTTRQGYLDELERRDPGGFVRWLAAGADPGSDPSKYVNTLDRRAPDAA